jgi:hypothetical protein
MNSSPAIGVGFPLSDNGVDFENKPFKNPPSIGAFEGDEISSISSESNQYNIRTTRTLDGIWLTIPQEFLPKKVSIIHLNGALAKTLLIQHETIFIPLDYHQFLIW